MEHDPDMTDYLEYTGNPYFLPESREKEAWTDEQEMASPSIPDKARRAPWEAAQRAIPLSRHPTTQ
ncbi:MULTISPECIES: hypothetical protein [Acetobacteraceae]|uniref:hypothetical protein n=1 Tax=Acetobacteraceae TaxID=433 RepID=UPI00105760BA|nr:MULTISPECIES: hypothetical protein [Acetobacteraceae]